MRSISANYYWELWESAKVSFDRMDLVENWVTRMWANHMRYRVISDRVGVPWFVVGAIHMLESSMDFRTYLGNGQKLTQKTTIVPVGRGPFSCWEDGAVDAILRVGPLRPAAWVIPSIGLYLERYNGLGYARRYMNSPYLWACTNHYSRGKFVADGKFDPLAVSQQCGAMALFKRMEEIGDLVLLPKDFV